MTAITTAEVSDDTRPYIGSTFMLPFREDEIINRDRKQDLPKPPGLTTRFVFALQGSFDLAQDRAAGQ